MSQKKTLAIAGASGFIGRWFIKEYKEHYHIIALSRKKVRHNPDPAVEWRQADLYSLTSTREALQGADYALYLVHSMNPSTRLSQGSFDDTDLLLADNFARAAEHHELEHIVFVGGILPKEEGELSRHLRSRYEVEQTLSGRTTPLTTLRAGIIIGPGGSSFDIVRKLVQNLPVMACPQWCESRSQPVAVSDVLEILHQMFGRKELFGQAIEAGGSEVVTYMDMLRRTARHMGRKRLIFSVPIQWVGFSKYWVARFTGSSTTLVSPLIESLRHTMTVGKSSLPSSINVDYKGIDETISRALNQEEEIYQLPDFERNSSSKDEKNTVRSFQRLPNPRQLTAHQAARLYRKWLPRFFRSIIKVRLEDKAIHFCLLGFSRPILSLKLVADRSHKNRQLFFITGGMLVKRPDYGWLEFRRVLGGRYIIAAIHEYVPRLPWYVYINSQALFHLWVMRRFGKYLERL